MLTRTEYKVLRAISYLKERGGVTPTISEIADYLERSGPTVMDKIKVMEGKGFLKKSRQDRSIELLCDVNSMVKTAKFISSVEFPAVLWDGINIAQVQSLFNGDKIEAFYDGEKILTIINHHQVKVSVSPSTWILKGNDEKIILIELNDVEVLNQYEIVPM